MYCVNCEFEIKNTGQNKCPICGWALIEYPEIENLSDESKVNSEPEGFSETAAQGVKESTFFDLESALNTDDEGKEAQKPESLTLADSLSEPEYEPERVAEEGSTNDVLASLLDKFDPIEEPVSPVSEEPEPGPKRLSKVLPAIVVIVLLVTVAAMVSILFFRPQLELYLPILQRITDTENKARLTLNKIMKKEKEESITKKESETVTFVQTTKKEIYRENSDSVKETVPVTGQKDLQPSGIKASAVATVKKKKRPDKSVEKGASPTNSYSIHTGSYIKKNVAVKESKRLKQLGFDAYIQSTDLGKGEIWYRVKVGKFNTREDAQKVKNVLRQKCPEIKSYIMVRKAKSQKPLTNEAGKKSIAIEKPTLVPPQPVQIEPPQQETVPAEPAPPLNKTVSADEKLPDPEIDTAPFVPPQPVQIEPPQQETVPAEPAPPLNKTVSADEKLPDPEIDIEPLVPPQPVQIEPPQQKTVPAEPAPPLNETVSADEKLPVPEIDTESLVPPQHGQMEIPQEDLDSIETIPVIKPKKTDQSSLVNVPLGNTTKGEVAVETGKEITSQKTVYSIHTNTYKIKKIAVNETVRFKFLGFDDAYVQKDDLGKGEIWYRVMIGEFSSLEEAEKVQNDLRQRDPELKSVIMKLENQPTR